MIRNTTRSCWARPSFPSRMIVKGQCWKFIWQRSVWKLNENVLRVSSIKRRKTNSAKNLLDKLENVINILSWTPSTAVFMDISYIECRSQILVLKSLQPAICWGCDICSQYICSKIGCERKKNPCFFLIWFRSAKNSELGMIYGYVQRTGSNPATRFESNESQFCTLSKSGQKT